jgi:hypothetical protein
MTDCKYCGKSAGFLKNKHNECEARYKNGSSAIVAVTSQALSNNQDLRSVLQNAQRIGQDSYIPQPILRDLLHRGWASAIDKAFEDGVLTEEEDTRLEEMFEVFGFDKETLSSDPAYEKIVKGAVLRDILSGKMPERIRITGAVPFNLQKREKLIWLFNGVKYYEMRTYRQYVGGYQGLSMRIAKGLYYRTGAFRGSPVETNRLVHVDIGFLGVTNLHVYYSGTTKGFRIKYDKIVSFQPYSDGLGIQRDAQTAKPQIFVTGDGWFTGNLIMNLAKTTIEA